MSLNPSQLQAVESTEGPVMILAGAGSGKTKTLVSRISHLLKKKEVNPYKLLALTFSNKAAKEMRERVSLETGLEMGTVQMTTFHSFAAQVLRREVNYLGLSQNFTIYDELESRAIAKNILAQKNIGMKEISPYTLLQYIEQLKNQGYYPGHLSRDARIQDQEEEKKLLEDELYPLYLEYEFELKRSNAVDFGGLIVGVVELFEKFPQVLEQYQSRFEYVLVDEYQDTNRAQFLLIELLCRQSKNICVVGDEDQSIYSWRGADIRNILDFEKIYPETKFIKLEQNYRSSKTIIEAASFVIARNQYRKGKDMWTENNQGAPLVVVECSLERDEALFLAEEIKKLAETGVSLKEIAVFYRGNAQSRLLEDALRQKNIAYRIIGGIKFYERKEIKDIVAYLRVVVNTKDSLAFSRIVNVPVRGIGATTLRKLEEEAVKWKISLYELVYKLVEYPKEFEHLKIGPKLRIALTSLISLITEIKMNDDKRVKPSLLVEKIIHGSGYANFLRENKDYETMARLENLEEFVKAVKEYESIGNEQISLSHFLESITLQSNTDENRIEDQVSLMTVHSSKGLEFEYVFVVGVEENVFPSYQSLETGDTKVEEERRLFYVAMTRAMKQLYLTFSQSRMVFGSLKFNGPSRFLEEIPAHFYEWKKFKSLASPVMDEPIDNSWNNSWEEKTFFTDSSQNKKKYKAGSIIQHALYGRGQVLQTEGAGNQEKVLIRFEGGVKKNFLVEYAPLTLLK